MKELKKKKKKTKFFEFFFLLFFFPTRHRICNCKIQCGGLIEICWGKKKKVKKVTPNAVMVPRWVGLE